MRHEHGSCRLTSYPEQYREALTKALRLLNKNERAVVRAMLRGANPYAVTRFFETRTKTHEEVGFPLMALWSAEAIKKYKYGGFCLPRTSLTTVSSTVGHVFRGDVVQSFLDIKGANCLEQTAAIMYMGITTPEQTGVSDPTIVPFNETTSADKEQRRHVEVFHDTYGLHCFVNRVPMYFYGGWYYTPVQVVEIEGVEGVAKRLIQNADGYLAYKKNHPGPYALYSQPMMDVLCGKPPRMVMEDYLSLNKTELMQRYAQSMVRMHEAFTGSQT